MKHLIDYLQLKKTFVLIQILGLQLGKYGAFIGCNNYPECKYTKQIANKKDGNPEFDNEIDFDQSLGKDPDTNEDVFIKKGPYGSYVQLGDGKKPKRVSIPKLVNPKDINLEKALLLLSLPRVIGNHPETNKEITANIEKKRVKRNPIPSFFCHHLSVIIWMFSKTSSSRRFFRN